MAPSRMSFRDKLTLGLLVLMAFFLMCDVFITPGIINELSAEFGVSVGTIGFAGSAFVLVGAFISLFFGYFSDKISRKKLLVATVFIGEIPCLLTGVEFFTPDFQSFLMMRVLTGIGVGGIYPITFSLVSDYFSSRHRAHACAWVDMAWTIGMMVGPMLAVYALTTAYHWRLAFILAALPSFPVVILFALFAKDPDRGRTEDALKEKIEEGIEYSKRIQLKDFKLIFTNKTNIVLFSVGIPGCIPWGILPFWLITYFEVEKGFTKIEAASMWEIFGISVTVGALIWAIIGDKVFSRDPRLLALMCSVGTLLGTIPLYIIINLPPDFLKEGGNNMIIYIGLILAAGLLITITASNAKAIIMNVNRPEHRGSVFSLHNIVDSTGRGIGPALGGLLVSSGYVVMMNFAVSWWLLCGVMWFFMVFTIKADREKLLSLLEKRADQM